MEYYQLVEEDFLKKFILGFIIGAVLFGGVSYALRLEEPPKFTDLTNKNELVNLNFILEKVQDILNGKINIDVDTSIPTGTSDVGNIKFSNVSGTYKLHAFINGAWRSWSSD